MNKGLWTVRRASALLAALLAVLATVYPARAADPAPDANLALVPADADAFFTARAAALAGKLGLKDGKHTWAAAWKKQFGVPLENVARCTLVCPDCEAADGATCVIISTEKPYKRAEVLKACAPDAKAVKHHKKICHVSATNNAAVHFVNDRLLIVADSEKALAKCLAHPTSAGETNPVADAVALAGKHDVMCWSRAVASKPAPAVACYKPPFGGAAATVARKPNIGAGVVSAPRPGNGAPLMLAFLPVPMPASVESGTLTVDVGEQVAVELRLDCADEAGAKKAAKVMRAFIGLMRAELLAAVSELDLAEVMPSMTEVDVKELASLPLKLMRQGEKGLAHVRVKAEGKTVPLSVSIPMEAKALRAEVMALERLTEAACANGGSCLPFDLPWGVGTPNSLVPPPPPPAYMVPPGYAPAMPLDAPVPQPVYPTPIPADPIVPPPTAPPAGPRVTPTAPANCVPPAPSSSILQSSAIGAVVGAACSTEPSHPAKKTVQLTVANVRKETVLLFTMEDGKLDFYCKLEPGEAADVPTMAGKRWAAVCADSADTATFVPTPENTTWLLRREVHTGRAQY